MKPQNTSEILFLIIILTSTLLWSSCQKKDNIDTEHPAIDLSSNETFPLNCDTLYFGEPFELNLTFSDNTELSAFSIDIHNNFNHHSHSTEIEECELGEKKEGINPLVFIQDYDLPQQKKYTIRKVITIPMENEEGIFDEGDYHFFIQLTDKEGWSAQKGLSIKILHRQKE